MHQRSFALWYCKLLFLASSLELQQNSTNTDVKQNDNLMMKYELYMNIIRNEDKDKVELLQSNVRENSTNNDDLQYNFHTNSSSYYKDDNSMRHKVRMRSIKNHKESNQMLMEVRMNSTKIDEKDNSTSIYGNFTKTGNKTQTENKNNSTLYKFHENANISIVPYEMCDNITCIQLCCSLGDLFIDKCIAGKDDYPFPDEYDYIKSNLLRNNSKKLDELVIHDPCQENRCFPIIPDEYTDEYVQARSYCLAIYQDKFEMTNYFESLWSWPSCWSWSFPDYYYFNVTIVILIVTLLFLLPTFVVYSILPELWNTHGYTVLGYVGSLSVAYMCLLVRQLTELDTISSVCVTIGFIIYFSFLASSFWLNVICLDIWLTFRGFRSLQENRMQQDKKRFIIYSIYAWGGTSIFTIVCVIMDFVPNIPKKFIRPEFGVENCWFKTDVALMLYFYEPLIIIIIFDICLFISTAWNIARQKKDTAHYLRSSVSQRHNDNKQWSNLYYKLFILMGLYWFTKLSLEIFSWLYITASLYTWDLFDVANMIHAIVLFIILVCKKEIKQLLLKRFGYQNRSPRSRQQLNMKRLA